MEKEKTIKNLLIILLSLVIILVITKISYLFKPIIDLGFMFLGPIIIGGFIYYWLRPLTRKLASGKMKKYKGLISIGVIILFFMVLVIVLSSAGGVLTEQLQDTIMKISQDETDYMKLIEEKLADFNLDSSFYKKYIEEGKNYLLKLASNIPGIFSGLFSGIGNFTTQLLLVPFILFYLLKDEDEIANNLKAKFPSKYKNQARELFQQLDGVLSTYIVGQLLVALIIGVLMFFGYLIIKMPNAFLMASFSVVTAVIPFIGAFIGILPAIIIALTVDFGLAIKIVILSIIVQQIEGNFITPNFMGSRLNIHPFIVMIVVIISINLLGLFGAFIGIPLYLVITILTKALIKFKKSKEKTTI